MPSGYNGAVIPPPGQDSPTPQPGFLPTLQLPVDADGGSSASLYQPFKSLADFVAYLQSVALYRPPLVNGAVPGFTGVTQVGVGAGTVTPTAASPTVGQNASWGRDVVITISTGGAAGGAARFKWSNDGGINYGGAQALPAGNYTDGTSGITVTFAGNFTLNDTYAFEATCCPLAQFADIGGNVRSVIDYNGYLQPADGFVESWMGANIIPGANTDIIAVAGTNGAIMGSRWVAAKPNGTGTVKPQLPTASYPCESMLVTPSNAAADNTILAAQYIGLNPNMVLVASWDLLLTAVGVNKIFSKHGFWSSAPLTGASDQILFAKDTTDTNWQIVTRKAAGLVTSVDSGVPPVANTYQRFKIAYHGTSTTLGAALGVAVALFFINETLVGYYLSSGGALPTAFTNMQFGVSVACTTNGATDGAQLGHCQVAFNRFLSLPAL
jgi:hypothetical protein